MELYVHRPKSLREPVKTGYIVKFSRLKLTGFLP